MRKLDELREYVEEFELDIIGVAETWLIDKAEVSVDGYTAYRKDMKEVDKATGGGVIMYVKDEISSSQVWMNEWIQN